MELDLNRATRVYGSSRAAWFQDGRYFGRDGQLIPDSEAALPAEDAEPTAPEPIVEPTGYTAYTEITRPAEVEHPPVEDPPIEREAGAKTWGEDSRLKLKALSGTVLANMVMRAGGTPATGYGAKKKNIEWLLENVKD